MSKKQDAYYFDNFYTCADYACQAAHLLDKVLRDFNPERIKEKLDEMHEVEHSADEKKHDLLNVLTKAFITPLEREDITLLSQNIDEVIDKIEDVLLRIYCNNVRIIRPDALKLCEVIIRCSEAVKKLLAEFADFRKSKQLYDYIVTINTLEEEADELFISSMRMLHTTCSDPIMVITWREIYIYLEKCVDACEHVADTVEGVIMKNS